MSFQSAAPIISQRFIIKTKPSAWPKSTGDSCNDGMRVGHLGWLSQVVYSSKEQKAVSFFRVKLSRDNHSQARKENIRGKVPLASFDYWCLPV